MRAPSATTPSETKPSNQRVVASGDQRRTGEAPSAAQPHRGGDLVADEADYAGGPEHPQVREVLQVDEAQDGLVERDAGGDENREHDGEAASFSPRDERRKKRSRAALPTRTR